MKRMITLLATAGCLLFATSCNKDNDKQEYATNKAGERLVEKIESVEYDGLDTSYHSYRFAYNGDGTFKNFTLDRKCFGPSWTDGFFSDITTSSFEKKNNTLQLHQECLYPDKDRDTEVHDETFDLNTNGFIAIDHGWDGTENYRLSYDESGKYLHNVFDGDELIWTFEWKDGNIVNSLSAYTNQPHPVNIDWGAFFQSWRNDALNEDLVDLSSIRDFWAFSNGYLGNKCQGLLAEDSYYNYTYDFDADGFVSTIYTSPKSSETSYKGTTYIVTYKKR
ncbi:MAG: hypothetical protein NC048_02770 [Bacteroides sp.]|nr:hypothetical protein [Bacteroides sp.]MCM1531437.1 hypothetical protein [Ruminococcus flavefaciens]MCM1554401.1 hypothetical protein [Bacteroides sp.]